MRLINKLTSVLVALIVLTISAVYSFGAAIAGSGSAEADAPCNGPAVAFLGDSNTWTGGDDCSGARAWSHWLVERLHPRFARSFARSGATLCNTVSTPPAPSHYTELLNDTNTFYNQALRLRLAVECGAMPVPDVIYVSGGTNDAWFADRRPGLADADDGALPEVSSAALPSQAPTLRRSLRLILALLRDVAPEARIVFVGPAFTIKAPKARISAVTDIIAEVAESEGCGMVRLDTTAVIDPDVELKGWLNTLDGTHTSVRGAREVARMIPSIND